MLASIVLVSASWIAQATGSIAGCIMDPMRQPLPGVTVVAAGESSRHITETNKTGCFQLNELSPGPYRVTARLTGFTNVTRDNVIVGNGVAPPFDVTLNISPMCECVRIGGTLTDHVRQAEAVLHLHITGPLAGQPAGATYYQHAATVLHAIKLRGQSVSTIALVQRQTSGAPDPYERDQEMVAFLQSAGSPGFAIVNDAPELNVGQQKPAMVFLVRDGRITDAPTDFAEYVGATLDGFSYELRAAAAGAGPDFSGRWKFSMEPDFRGKATTVTGEIDQRGIDLVVRCRDEETAVMRGVLNARTAWKRPAQVKRRT